MKLLVFFEGKSEISWSVLEIKVVFWTLFALFCCFSATFYHFSAPSHPHFSRNTTSPAASAMSPSDEDSSLQVFGRRVLHVLEEKLTLMREYQEVVKQKPAESESGVGGKIVSLFAAMLNVNHRRSSSAALPSSLAARQSSKRRARERSPAAPRPKRASIDDFEIIKPISRGAFGRVFLARKKTTHDLYAIKILKKNDMVRKNMVNHVFAERTVLALARNPYVVKMFFAFHSRDNLYLVMEYLIGGDLSSLLQGFGRFPLDWARFYAAEIALALEYLHAHGIAHRDLKPDNVLINAEGHIKLTDFGLSRIIVNNQEDEKDAAPSPAVVVPPPTRPLSKSNSTPNIGKILKGPAPARASAAAAAEAAAAAVPTSAEQKKGSARAHNSSKAMLGTPDYLAPELLLGIGHGPEVDWWALGVCIFEFLTGAPPFSDDTPELIFKNILANGAWTLNMCEVTNDAFFSFFRVILCWFVSFLGHFRSLFVTFSCHFCHLASFLSLFPSLPFTEMVWPEDPEDMPPPDAVDLIKRLLNHDPTKRLKAADVKSHAFFASVDWENLRSFPAPFIPKPESFEDTSYFDARNDREDIRRLQAADTDPIAIPSPLASAHNSDSNDGDERAGRAAMIPGSLLSITGGGSPDDERNDGFDVFQYKNIEYLEELNKNALSRAPTSAPGSPGRR